MIERRTLLQSLLGLVGAGRYGRAALPAAVRQAAPAPPASAALSTENIATLAALAEVVFPTALGERGRASAVDRFVRWHRNYREGADRGHSYGASTLSQPSGPAAATRYPAQFAWLDAQARTRGAATFAALSLSDRRQVVEAMLNEPTRVTAMPARPNGANLVADFMGYFFSSAEASDIAYDAAIGRDSCRGLDGSERAPLPLGRG